MRDVYQPIMRGSTIMTVRRAVGDPPNRRSGLRHTANGPRTLDQRAGSHPRRELPKWAMGCDGCQSDISQAP
jgi:hypothetical protein